MPEQNSQLNTDQAQQQAARDLAADRQIKQPLPQPEQPAQPEPGPQSETITPAQETAAKVATDADKKTSRKEKKQAKKEEKKQAKTSARQDKAAMKYNPIYFILATTFVGSYEFIMLIINLLTVSVSAYVDWIGDLIVFPAIGMFLWTQGESDANARFKRLFGRLLIALGIESIPYLDYLPMWTLTVLWVWFTIRKKHKESK